MSIVALTLSVPASFAEGNAKIGYVDLSRLFDEYYKTKEYDKVLEEKSKAFEKERNDKIEKIKEAQGKLALLADDKKKQMEQDVEKMKADLLEFDRQKKTDLTKERNEKIREILLEIEKIVSDFAKKESYSVILNDRVLIYGEAGLNLTEQVLKSLNDGQAKK
jgi:outer membrane protein